MTGSEMPTELAWFDTHHRLLRSWETPVTAATDPKRNGARHFALYDKLVIFMSSNMLVNDMFSHLVW